MSRGRWKRAPLLLVLPLLLAFGPDESGWSDPAPKDRSQETIDTPSGPDDAQEPASRAAAGAPSAPPSWIAVALDVTGSGGIPVQVSAQVPSDWIALAPSPARLEYMGRDRRSRLYVRAMAAAAGRRSCSAQARDYAREVIQSWGSAPRSRLVNRVVLEGEVGFELARRDPRPEGERVLGRVVCQSGLLVVISCVGPAAPTGSEDTVRPLCEHMVGSLQVGDDDLRAAR